MSIFHEDNILLFVLFSILLVLWSGGLATAGTLSWSKSSSHPALEMLRIANSAIESRCFALLCNHHHGWLMKEERENNDWNSLNVISIYYQYFFFFAFYASFFITKWCCSKPLHLRNHFIFQSSSSFSFSLSLSLRLSPSLSPVRLCESRLSCILYHFQSIHPPCPLFFISFFQLNHE